MFKISVSGRLHERKKNYLDVLKKDVLKKVAFQ